MKKDDLYYLVSCGVNGVFDNCSKDDIFFLVDLVAKKEDALNNYDDAVQSAQEAQKQVDEPVGELNR